MSTSAPTLRELSPPQSFVRHSPTVEEILRYKDIIEGPGLAAKCWWGRKIWQVTVTGVNPSEGTVMVEFPPNEEGHIPYIPDCPLEMINMIK